MEFETKLAIVEAMMFATGGIVTVQDIMKGLEIGSSEIEIIMMKLKEKYEKQSSRYRTFKS